jgi:hypothetical protein
MMTDTTDTSADDDVVAPPPDAGSVRHFAEVLREKGYHQSADLMEGLLARAEKAEAERDTTHAILDGRMSDLTELRVKELHMAGGSLEMQLQAGIIPVIGAFLVAEFKSQGATNYLALECDTEELGPMVLTIQRKWGEQPAQVAAAERTARQRAEAERKLLLRALGDIERITMSQCFDATSMAERMRAIAQEAIKEAGHE